MNPAWETVLGFTAHELLSTPYEWLIHPDDVADTRRSVSEQLQGNTTIHFANRYRTKDGAYRWLDWHAAAAEDNNLYATARDVTDARQAEVDKSRLEAELRQSQKMEVVGRLAGGVAHDFNNMLGVIIGHAEMAGETVDATFPLGEHLAEILAAANRAARVTRQLLTFARKQEIAPEVVNLNATVAGGLKMLRRLIGENIQLDCVYAANLWPVRIDSAQMEQVLANLCLNARDAINGVGTVSLRTANRSCDEDTEAEFPGAAGRDYVRLEVSDDGCGMNAATLQHVFEPFFTTKEVGAGTGLGLASAFGAIAQNGGGLIARSQPGIGTTFTICLPRYLGEVPRPDSQRLEVSPSTGGETILVVEDEPALLDLAAAMLRKQGYTVLVAATPSEATRLAHETSGDIHLLLTDVLMPEMNGCDLARHLSTLRPGLKRLFMSGHTADFIHSLGLTDGEAPLIHKPFSVGDLTNRVREVLNGNTH